VVPADWSRWARSAVNAASDVIDVELKTYVDQGHDVSDVQLADCKAFFRDVVGLTPGEH
jgi:hypothetical protein